MEDGILLVPFLDLTHFPNDLHLQFNQTQDEQMDAEFDVNRSISGRYRRDARTTSTPSV